MSIKPSPSISIRRLHAWDEYLAAEELQRVVWQMPDWRDAVPANLMITVQKNTGIVLGAFDGTRLIGLAFGFVGIDHHFNPPALKHCSHMLAVLPEYQSLRIGLQLKLKQRELALEQGLELMTWTFDPLLALNANLNLVRLGAIARRYVTNAYGEMTDGLNAGLASDRFEVEWWLNSSRTLARLTAPPPRTGWATLLDAGAHSVFEIEYDRRQLPRIESTRPLEGDSLLVEIPTDLAALKAGDPSLARAWRAETRDVFQRAFAAGYAATDLTRQAAPSPRTAYVLTREPLPGCAR